MRKAIKKWLGIESIEDKVDEMAKLRESLIPIGIGIRQGNQTHSILIYSETLGRRSYRILSNFKDIDELEDFIEWIVRRFELEGTFKRIDKQN